MTWNDMKWYRMTWNEMIWNKIKLNDMTWNEMNKIIFFNTNWLQKISELHKVYLQLVIAFFQCIVVFKW